MTCTRNHVLNEKQAFNADDLAKSPADTNKKSPPLNCKTQNIFFVEFSFRNGDSLHFWVFSAHFHKKIVHTAQHTCHFEFWHEKTTNLRIQNFDRTFWDPTLDPRSTETTSPRWSVVLLIWAVIGNRYQAIPASLQRQLDWKVSSSKLNLILWCTFANLYGSSLPRTPFKKLICKAVCSCMIGSRESVILRDHCVLWDSAPYDRRGIFSIKSHRWLPWFFYISRIMLTSFETFLSVNYWGCIPRSATISSMCYEK